MSKYIENSIEIKVPAAKLWEILTSPEWTSKYMYGCKTVSDWKEGSDLLWEMMHEGNKIIAVKGKILKIEQDRLLEYTVIDPNSDIEDIPENYLNVTYTLTPEGDQTRLDVTQGDYDNVADGETRYEHSYNNGEGWMPILKQIKTLAESE